MQKDAKSAPWWHAPAVAATIDGDLLRVCYTLVDGPLHRIRQVMLHDKHISEDEEYFYTLRRHAHTQIIGDYCYGPGLSWSVIAADTDFAPWALHIAQGPCAEACTLAHLHCPNAPLLVSRVQEALAKTSGAAEIDLHSKARL